MRRPTGQRFLITILAGIMILCFSGLSSAKTIKVGAAINMTGPASTWGQYHAKGQQDYFRYVNEVKGGVAGNRIEMTLVDTAYKVPEAVSAVRKFAVQEKVAESSRRLKPCEFLAIAETVQYNL